MKSLDRVKYILSLTAVLLFSGAVAYSYTVSNTPESGYLLCANPKTKAVIFPNRLSCPTGFNALELGAKGSDGIDGIDGNDGIDGIDGRDGSSGSGTLWGYRIQTKDVVAPSGSVTKFSDLKKVVLASISKSNLQGGGNYVVRAHISGLWGNGAKSNAYIKCYFQSAKDYPEGSQYFGSDSGEYSNWSGIDLTVFAEPSDYSLSQDNVYLVCATDGNISGLGGYISAISLEKSQGMGLSAPPNV